MTRVAEPLASPAIEERGPALLQPLRDRDFRLLFGGETISVVGDHFHFVALAWLTLQLTGSGVALGTVLMTAAVPRAAFMLLGGALSDRWSPRSLMLGSNAIRAVVMAIISVLVLTGNAQLWQLYVLAGIFGIVDAAFYPAIGTIMPMLVAEPRLPAANALVQGSQQLAGLIGPALAGLLVAAVQTGPAFVIDAVSFTVAAAALVLIRGGRRAAATESGSSAQTMLETIGSGLRYAWSDPAIRTLVVLTAALNFAFEGPVSVGLAWLANNRFEGGSAAFGFILSAFGAGALLGAIFAGSVRARAAAGRRRPDHRRPPRDRSWTDRGSTHCSAGARHRGADGDPDRLRQRAGHRLDSGSGRRQDAGPRDEPGAARLRRAGAGLVGGHRSPA